MFVQSRYVKHKHFGLFDIKICLDGFRIISTTVRVKMKKRIFERGRYKIRFT